MKPYEESSIFPVGGENTAFAQYFDGTSYLNMLSLEQVVVGNVTFEPGCRNHWHIHKASEGGGQILLVTAGRGYYQEWGRGASGASPGRCSEYLAECKALAWGCTGQRIPASGDRGAGQGHIERVVRTGR